MASNSTISITFKLDGDGKGFKALAQDANGFKTAVTGAIKEAERLNTGAINFAAIATAVDQAQGMLRGLQSTLKDFADAYAVQEVAEKQLETVMRQRMGATEADIQGIKDLASAQQKLGVIGDEVQLAGAQQVATFLAQKSSIETLLPAMNDLLAQQKGLNATGSDAVSIGNLMGKAMQGQTTALKRVGITFTDAQEQVMKYGDESQRASMLAQIITDNVGHMNAELAKTDSGKQKQLENTLGDIKEQLGKMTNAALPFVTIAANSLIALGGVVKLVAGVRTATTGMSTWNIKGMATAAMCKLVGVSSTKSAALVRVFSSAMQGGAYSATALKLAVRGLLIATGIGAAITALTLAIEYFIGKADKAADSTNNLIDAEKRAQREAERTEELRQQENRTLEDTRAGLALNISRLKEFNGTKAEEKKLVKEMNDTYGDTMGYFASVSDWYKALIGNSEAYCKQMVLEARTRMLANQIAQKQQENYEITHNDDGTKRKYSSKRDTYQTDQRLQGYDSFGNAIYTPGFTKEIEGSSEVEKAQAAYDANTASIKAMTEQLNNTAKELADISFSVTGSATQPSEGGNGGATATETPKWKEDAANLKEIGDNVRILQEQLQTASVEEAAEINQQIALWQAKADAIRNAGKSVEDNSAKWREDASNLKEIGDNIKILQERLQTVTAEEAVGINQQIALWEAKADAIKNAGKAVEEEKKPEFDETATTLQGINTNIDILNGKLQTASIEEAAMLNKQIALWEDKADAIKNAGKEVGATFSDFKAGWGAVKGMSNAVSGLSTTLESDATAWEKTMAVVDAFISMYDGLSAIIGVVEALTAVSTAHSAAKTVEGTATTAATVATTAAAAAAPVEAAAEIPLIAANKSLAASFLEVAAASYFAAHAYIPFVGFGIASGFATSAAAITKAMGVMAFADGGIAYGPTLGLFGEYAGASNNPEVVAPLDKLKDLIGDNGGGPGGYVEFEIRGDRLVGILNKYNRKYSRV